MVHDQSIAGLAMVLAQSNKIKVTVSGDGSYISSDGMHINIARMPDTPVGRMLATGLTMHEVGHKNHSKCDSRPSGLVGDMANIIEDIWTEKMSIAERPGVSFNLNAVMKHYVEKGSFEPANLNHALIGKVMAYGRSRLLNQPSIAPLEDACNEMIDDAFGQAFISELDKILSHLDKISSTPQAIGMATKIVNLVLHPPPPPPPPPQPQQAAQQASSDPQEDDGGGQEGDSQGNDSGSPSQLDSSSSQAGSQAQAPQAQPQASGAQDGQQAPSANSGSGKAQLSKQAVQDIVDAKTDFGNLSKMVMAEMDELASNPPNDTPLLPNIDTWSQSSRPLNEVDAIAASSRMRARLIGFLEATKHKPTAFGLSGKKIASSRLPKLAIGDPRIFKKKVETKSANTAIVIALDKSGSMRGDRSQIADPAAFALHNALYSLSGVKACSIAYSNCNDGINVHILADFDRKPIARCFSHKTDGSTPTHEAMWAARAMLLCRQEPRKILLILTDGEPDDSWSVRAATKALLKDGIEIAALGIESVNLVKHFWENSADIASLQELPGAMFGMLQDMLVKQKR